MTVMNSSHKLTLAESEMNWACRGFTQNHYFGYTRGTFSLFFSPMIEGLAISCFTDETSTASYKIISVYTLYGWILGVDFVD